MVGKSVFALCFLKKTKRNNNSSANKNDHVSVLVVKILYQSDYGQPSQHSQVLSQLYIYTPCHFYTQQLYELGLHEA